MNPDSQSPYGAQAKARISTIGRSELSAFFRQIPRATLKAALRRLPDIDGFRPDSDAGVDEQRRRLVRRLSDDSGQAATQRDWSLLESLWSFWVQIRLEGNPIAPAVKSYLKAARAERDAALEELLLICFSEAENETVSKETLSEFFRFAPFDETNDIANVLKSATAESALADKQYLATLKNTIRSLESQAKDLAAAAEESRTRSDRLDAQQAETAKLVERMAAAIDAAKIQAQQNDKRHSDYESAIIVLESKVEALDAQIMRLEATLNEEIALLTDHSEKVKDSEHADNTVAAVHLDHRLYIPPLLVSREPVPINAKAALYQALRANLVTIGVDKGDVERVSVAILAAVCAGQLVCFRGAFASILLAAAVSVISESAILVDVELGKHEDADLRLLCELLQEPFVTLVFEGANRGAFELYASPFIDRVVLRQSNLPGKTKLVGFATLSSGPSTIPTSPAMTAIGPTIDTDCIRWRGNKKVDATLLGASLATSPWELLRPDKGLPEFVEVAITLLGKDSMQFRAAFELSIRNAGVAFGSLMAANEASRADCEISLVAYWCIPYLLSCGVTSEQLRKTIASSEFAEHIDHAAVAGALRG